MNRVLLISLLTTFSTANYAVDISSSYEVYGKQLNLHSLERVEENEIDNINQTVDILGKFFKKKYLNKSSPVKRGVHPRQHGCVNGKMTVNPDIPIDLQVGIFSPDKKYDVFIRYSNADPHLLGTDKDPDSRGFAMKVLNIDGDQLFPELGQSSQDFTLNTTDTFFADTPEDYRRFLKFGLIDTTSNQDAIISYIFDTITRGQLPKSTRILRAFLRISSVKDNNLFNMNYNSITARAHGSGPNAPVVKYQVQRCDEQRQAITFDHETNPRFLKENLVKTIENEEVCLSFQIQRMPKPKKSWNGSTNYQSKGIAFVEYLTTPWSQKESPFIEVAKISIPRQTLMDEGVCRSSVINPWITLEEHRPLGGISRLRLASYLFSAEMREKHRAK